MLVLHSMTGTHFADKPPSVSDAMHTVFWRAGGEAAFRRRCDNFQDYLGFNLSPNTGRIVVQKNKYGSVSKFATLSLMVIFISSLVHHDWWQAAGCVVAFELLARLPFIFNGKMSSGQV
jgi:hypothetical protein